MTIFIIGIVSAQQGLFPEFLGSPNVQLRLASDSAGPPPYNPLAPPAHIRLNDLVSVDPLQTMFSVHPNSHAVVPEFISATPILFQGDNPAPSLIGRTPPTASGSSTTSPSPQSKSLVVSLFCLLTEFIHFAYNCMTLRQWFERHLAFFVEQCSTK